MGDLVARGDAPNKKMAEKMCALDACVKLAQLGRLQGAGGGLWRSRQHTGSFFQQ